MVLILSAQIGDVLCKKVHRSQEEGGRDFGVVLTGALRLPGLVIGFRISMGISRYDLRKNHEQAAVSASFQRSLMTRHNCNLGSGAPFVLRSRRCLQPQQGLVLSGGNDIVLTQRSTQAAWWHQIPASVWVLLAVISVGCTFLISYRARRTDWLVFVIMPVALSISFFLISDLDSPRGGAIRLVPHNLINLPQSLHSQ